MTGAELTVSSEAVAVAIAMCSLLSTELSCAGHVVASSRGSTEMDSSDVRTALREEPLLMFLDTLWCPVPALDDEEFTQLQAELAVAPRHSRGA